MTRLRRLPAVLFVAALALTSASAVAAQQAKDVLETALEKYEARMKSIENYTVVQKVMGMSVSTYFERQDVDGHSVFVSPNSSGREGMQAAAAADAYRNMMKVAESATYGGRQDVGGRTAHVIRIDDPESLGFNTGMAAGGDGNFEADDVTLFISTDDYVILRFEFSGTATVDGQRRPISTAINFEDYRTVDGLLHPFRTTFDMAGLMAAGNVSEEDRAKAQKSLEELDKQMASMPESQRKMMEGMLGDQLKQLRAMLEPGGGQMTIEVSEVKVNAGPPGK